MNTYQKCEHCRQYINTVTTDHVRAIDSEQEIYLHINPCWRIYSEEHELTEEHLIRNHKRSS